MLGLVGLTGCSGIDRVMESVGGGGGGVIGAVVADEPRAVQIGREVLLAGGNAVDTATAVYFALSVTLPSMASLGGGGVCLVYRPEANRVETLEFFAETPRETVAQGPGARPTAIPGNVRGFFALHERFGEVAWEDILRPAEALARDGTVVSQTLADHLRLTWGFLRADREARRLFGRRDGGPVGKGYPLRQLDLATALAQIRAHGPGEFYTGRLARLLVQDTLNVGGSLSANELRAMRPRWRQAVSVALPDPRDPEDADERWVVHAPPPPAAAGLVAAQVLAQVALDDRYRRTAPEARPHLVSEAAKRAFADRRRWGGRADSAAAILSETRARRLMRNYSDSRTTTIDRLDPVPEPVLENLAGTGFVTADLKGNAVACTVTPNNTFGTGRVAARTGIFAAASAEVANGGPVSLGPVMIVDPDDSELILAATGTGGVAGPTALAETLAPLLHEPVPLADAIAAPRVHHSGAPDVLYHERTQSGAEVAGLRRRGHELAVFPGDRGEHPGRVNAVYCPRGLPGGEDTCEVAADPRGSGLALRE